MGQMYEERFERRLVKVKVAIRRRGGRTLGPARIGPRGKVSWQPGQDRFYG